MRAGNNNVGEARTHDADERSAQSVWLGPPGGTVYVWYRTLYLHSSLEIDEEGELGVHAADIEHHISHNPSSSQYYPGVCAYTAGSIGWKSSIGLHRH